MPTYSADMPKDLFEAYMEASRVHELATRHLGAAEKRGASTKETVRLMERMETTRQRLAELEAQIAPFIVGE